jgi:hypothetical protein
MFSTQSQLDNIAKIVSQYLRLPMSETTVPGTFFENVLAYALGGEKLDTYDFVDVINRTTKIGWQVKSTKEKTPLTWKRAKIPDADMLIQQSHISATGLQDLGNSIINFCNHHAEESIRLYDLDELHYARLIIFDNSIKYLEKKLCDKHNTNIFDATRYNWKWSQQKNFAKKEQLPALHGFDNITGNKIWAWHGLGENQLHFVSEKDWWDDTNTVSIEFPFPTDKITMNTLLSI